MPSLISRQRNLSPQLQDIRAKARIKPRRFIQTQVRIVNLMGEEVPFHFNWAQNQFYNRIQEARATGKPIREWFIKYRRAGITAITSALSFVDWFSRDNAKIGVIAHLEDRAMEILQNYKDYYRSLAPELQLQLSKDNIRGIKAMHTGSRVLIATCNNPIKIRGDGLQWVDLTEAPHYGADFVNVVQEVCPVVPPKPNTGIIFEGTGTIRGCDAHKHAMAAKAGENEFHYNFLNWTHSPDCLIPFESQRHMQEIYDIMHQYEPRLTELANFYKLTPEQRHQLWVFYHYQSENSFDYCIREFPVHEDLAWSSGSASFFGQFELSKAKALKPARVLVFEDNYINSVFTNFDVLKGVDDVSDYHSLPNIKIWAYPQRGARYAIGADSALGESYGDWSAGSVRDIATREQMCTFHGRIRPDELAHIMVSLGKIYNNALLAPECNQGGGGLTVLQDIQRLSYHRIYTWRKRDSVDGMKHSGSYGWWTTQRSRPIMLGEQRRVFLESVNNRLPQEQIFRDISQLREMATFCPDPNTNVPKALTGCYDDRVIGDSITQQVCADEAYCTSSDLMRTKYKEQAVNDKVQTQIVQRVKPNDIFKTFTNIKTGYGKRGFEIDEQGRIV